MEWLNYHHLYYFWTVANQGSVSSAARELHLARPTVTSQVRELENACGQKLFRQEGRGLVLTEYGQSVFAYADDIFSIGSELKQFIETGHHGTTQQKLRVGVSEVVSSSIACNLIRPALKSVPKPKFEFRRGRLESLVEELATHRLEIVLADRAVPANAKGKLKSYPLARSEISILGSTDLASRFRKGFPQSLANAPILLPTADMSLRRTLDSWADSQGVDFQVSAESDDPSLLEELCRAGEGLFPVTKLAEPAVLARPGVQLVGRLPDVTERYFGIAVDQRVRHEAVAALLSRR